MILLEHVYFHSTPTISTLIENDTSASIVTNDNDSLKEISYSTIKSIIS